MKIIERMEEELNRTGMVSLRKVANDLRIDYIEHYEAFEILSNFTRLHKTYKLIKIDGKSDSLFEHGGIKRNDIP